MARYEHLQVFKDCYDLTLGAIQIIRTFPKSFKYSLGNDISQNLFLALTLIQKTNSSFSKNVFQTECIIKLELIKMQFRLAKDLQCLSQDAYLSFAEKTENVLRQMEGWKNKSSKMSGQSLVE